MTLEEFRQKFSEEDAVGWMEIDSKLESFYPEQEPSHYAPMIKYILGGNDPLDGISYYHSDIHLPHYHAVSYGFSNLYYDEKALGGEFSKWGFELTYRTFPYHLDKELPFYAGNVMQNLARYVYESERWFEPYHYIPLNSSIRLDSDTKIKALLFVMDPELGEIDTLYGKLQFLQMVGITETEYQKILDGQYTPKELINKAKETNPLLITDLNREHDYL